MLVLLHPGQATNAESCWPRFANCRNILQLRCYGPNSTKCIVQKAVHGASESAVYACLMSTIKDMTTYSQCLEICAAHAPQRTQGSSLQAHRLHQQAQGNAELRPFVTHLKKQGNKDLQLLGEADYVLSSRQTIILDELMPPYMTT